MSDSTGWDHPPPDTNATNADSMPSAEAQAARERAKEIMEASRNGKPGEADAMMGQRRPQGAGMPIEWIKNKLSRKDKGKQEGDGVVR